MNEACLYESPIGAILLRGDSDFVTNLAFVEDNELSCFDPKLLDGKVEGELTKAIFELGEYFSGNLRDFTVRIQAEGTPFRRKVWEELMKIPYGETISYSCLAKNIENPKAVRAVGGANYSNPVSIIIPCHRVIGKDGRLVGYGGGLWRKEWLLQHEKKYL